MTGIFDTPVPEEPRRKNKQECFVDLCKAQLRTFQALTGTGIAIDGGLDSFVGGNLKGSILGEADDSDESSEAELLDERIRSLRESVFAIHDAVAELQQQFSEKSADKGMFYVTERLADIAKELEALKAARVTTTVPGETA